MARGGGGSVARGGVRLWGYVAVISGVCLETEFCWLIRRNPDQSGSRDEH